jgi:hypothetical protein
MPADAAPTERGNTARALAHKTAQVRHLTRLVERTERHRIGDLLFRLARLELEVAILKAGPRGPDLSRAVTTCRRLLAERPRFAQADEARLFLARLELRRDRPEAALLVLEDLARRRPASRERCQAHLLAGACHLARKDHEGARRAFRGALSLACAAPVRRQARYQLAWIQLGAKQAAPAARELRQLCRARGLEPTWRSRVLTDLSLAWSLSPAGPDADAARFLLAHAPSPGAARRLILDLGGRLLDAGRVEPLLAFTAPVLGVRGLSRLRALRIRALARGGPSRRLERELEAAAPTLKRDRALRGSVANVILDLARRAQQRGRARRLYRRLVSSYAGTPAAGTARLRLGQLMLQQGENEHAATQLALAASQAPRPAQRALASHLQVYVLERLLDGADPDERRAALERFAAAARAFVARHADASAAPEVLLALGSRLLAERGREREAIAILERITRNKQQKPAIRRRAVELLVTALTRADLHERAYRAAARHISGDGGDPSRERFAKAAARAARLRSQQLAAAGSWVEAHRWAVRAAAHVTTAGERRRLLLAAATLAARAGEDRRAEAHLEALLKTAPPAERREVWVERARHREARGQLTGAAAIYRSLAETSRTLAEQLRWLERGASALALAGEPARAVREARRLQKLIAGGRLPARLVGRWQLRAGRVLERADPRAAYRHYFRQAHQLWRHDGRAAALCLVRAAGLASSTGTARRLYEQARVQAGTLRRGGAAAAEARLGLARLVRTRLAGTLPLVRRLRALHEAQAPLLELMRRASDPRWSAAAALELARNHAALADALRAAPVPSAAREEDRRRYRAALDGRVRAVGEVQRRLMRRLVAAAGTDQGISRHTLAASREIEGHPAPRWRLPATRGGPAAAILPLISAGRHRAAERVATAALAVHGPHADLYCSRAVARLRLERPREALGDLRRALRLTPDNSCARDNLTALNRLRGVADVRVAREERP